jgi:hypothetical protein
VACERPAFGAMIQRKQCTGGDLSVHIAKE